MTIGRAEWLLLPAMGKGKKKSVVIQGVEIGDAVAGGHCITRYNERVVFVKGAVPGDVANLRITKKRRKYFEAEIQELITPSPIRIEPFCAHFGTCGGCKWQHMPYEHQLKYKQQQVVDNLERIGKLALPGIEPILPATETTFYRNKLEFTFSNMRWLTQDEIQSGEDFDRRALGFHIPGRFDKVLAVDKCHLQHDLSNAIRNELRDYTLAKNLLYYDLVKQEGFLRNVILRNTADGQWMLILSVFHRDPALEAILDHLIGRFPELSSVYYVINNKKNDDISDLPFHHYHGDEYIREQMEGLRFLIGPKSFYQTNSHQAEELYKIVREMAAPAGHENMYDLYTGTGTIALFMARHVKKVVGVEYVDEAVQLAKENARINELANAQFYAGDMKDILNPSFLEEHGRPDIVVTDPPRAGMHENVVGMLRDIQPEKIVYVSCNPATQARDLQMLSDLYTIVRVKPVDMFPHTHHVENVVLLHRN